MCFWKYKELAQALKNSAISRGAYYGYIAIFVILGALFLLPSLLTLIQGETYGLQVFLIAAIWLGVTYFINNKGDRKDFVRRYICIFTPVFVRSFVFAALIGAAVAIIFGMAGIADALSGGNHDGFLTGPTGKGIATIFITLTGLWFMTIYPLIIYVRAFKIASSTVPQG